MNRVFVRALALCVAVGFMSCGPRSKKNEVQEQTKVDMATTPVQQVLIGTFTSDGSSGIYQMEFNLETRELSTPQLVAPQDNPGYLALSEDGNRVYSSNGADTQSVSAFEWNAERSSLVKVGEYPSAGTSTCYVSLSPDEKYLAAANYGGGNIIVYPIAKAGGLMEPSQVRKHQGSGPHPNQNQPHPHCVVFSKKGDLLYAVDLGIDQVLAYPVGKDGILGEPQIALQLDPGDGPRHLVFHPDKNQVFVVNELSSTVVSATIDVETGLFSRVDKKSSLPLDYKEDSYCADIHLGPEGKFLYASNRGHNSVAVFQLAADGTMELIQTEDVKGDWPRNFTLDPSGNYVLVANQNSGNITVFSRDSQTGKLSYTGNEVVLASPVCLKFY